MPDCVALCSQEQLFNRIFEIASEDKGTEAMIANDFDGLAEYYEHSDLLSHAEKRAIFDDCSH